MQGAGLRKGPRLLTSRGALCGRMRRLRKMRPRSKTEYLKLQVCMITKRLASMCRHSAPPRDEAIVWMYASVILWRALCRYIACVHKPVAGSDRVPVDISNAAISRRLASTCRHSAPPQDIAASPQHMRCHTAASAM